jgi:hypothetical protein
VLSFLPEILLHVSRGVRWDSDHVVVLNDDLGAIAQELVRGDLLSRTHIGLDYFDASINRVAAWVIGARNTQKALLQAMLEPTAKLRACEEAGDYTARLALLEEIKSLPWGAGVGSVLQRRGRPDRPAVAQRGEEVREPRPCGRALTGRALGSSQGDSMMRTVIADLRYAFRVMSRTPSFAVAVVGVLALGIGANTAIFSIVNAVLLRPLPFDEPERLVRIFTRTPGPDSRLFELSPGKFYDWQQDAQSFEGMAMYQCCGFRELALTGMGTARTVRATAVSAGFFEIVRARPSLGRVFRQEEDTPGGKHVGRPERPVLENRIRRNPTRSAAR